MSALQEDLQRIQLLADKICSTYHIQYYIVFNNKSGTFKREMTSHEGGIPLLAKPSFCVIPNPNGKDFVQKTTKIDSNNETAVQNHLYACFDSLKQLSCKKLAKLWVKVVEPAKQTKYPYNLGATSMPPWWPAGVEHREPDHLHKLGRVSLLIHLAKEFQDEKKEELIQNYICMIESKRATADYPGEATLAYQKCVVYNVFHVLESIGTGTIEVLKPTVLKTIKNAHPPRPTRPARRAPKRTREEEEDEDYEDRETKRTREATSDTQVQLPEQQAPAPAQSSPKRALPVLPTPPNNIQRGASSTLMRPVQREGTSDATLADVIPYSLVNDIQTAIDDPDGVFNPAAFNYETNSSHSLSDPFVLTGADYQDDFAPFTEPQADTSASSQDVLGDISDFRYNTMRNNPAPNPLEDPGEKLRLILHNNENYPPLPHTRHTHRR